MRVLPRVGHERDRAEVVDLVRLGGVDGAQQAGQVGEVSEHQLQAGDLLNERDLGVVLATDQAVDLVPLAQEQLGEVQPVLTGHSGDQRALHQQSPDS
jgi:hypothetical protein